MKTTLPIARWMQARVGMSATMKTRAIACGRATAQQSSFSIELMSALGGATGTESQWHVQADRGFDRCNADHSVLANSALQKIKDHDGSLRRL